MLIISLFFDLLMALNELNEENTLKDMSTHALLISLALFTGVTRLVAQSTLTEEEQIQKAAENFSAAYMKGDYQTMANIYTVDAVLMPPGQDMIYGKDAIYKFWSRDTLYHQVFHKSKSDRLEVKENIAFDNGFWYSESIYNGRSRPLASGKYLIIWRKEKGEWKMYHDIWNNRAAGWESKEKVR